MVDDDGALTATSPGIFGLEHNARALAALPPRDTTDGDADDDDMSLFLVGTQSPSAENVIHLLEYNDDTEDITPKSCAFPHGEIWSLATSPQPQGLFSVVFGPSHQRQAAVFSYEESATGLNVAKECSLVPAPAASDTPAFSQIECAWHPDTAEHVCTATTANTIACWDVSQQKQYFSSTHGDDASMTTAIKWSPHHNGTVVGAAFGDRVVLQDTSSNTVSLELPGAHLQAVRAIDFNPNKQYVMATGGDDGCVRIWDTRHAAKPLLIQHHHSHWVWSVHYNPFYDRLILTSGSDNEVLLNNVATASSDMSDNAVPAQGRDDGDSEDDDGDTQGDMDESPQQRAIRARMRTDCLLARYEDHEDSVYSSCWSCTDAWTLASLSYDGRVLISKVPSVVKFAVLL